MAAIAGAGFGARRLRVVGGPLTGASGRCLPPAGTSPRRLTSPACWGTAVSYTHLTLPTICSV
eukprot:7334316-Alexandrium_andersonii.AAC.1